MKTQAFLLAAAGLLVATSVLADTNADPAKIRCGNKGPYYGRADGVCHEVDTKAPVVVVNGRPESALNSSLMVSVWEDFVGDRVLPDVGSVDGSQGPWVCTATNQTTSCAQKADHDDGAMELLVDNGNEVGDITLYWGDESNIDSDKGLACIYRLKYQTQPAAADNISWGIIGAQADIIENTTNNAFFHIDGANNDLLISTDDNTTDDDGNDTTVDLVAGTFYEFKISLSSTDGASPTDVHFYYRATLGGDWTQLLPTTTFSIGADVALQPFVQVEKTSGTTTPDLLVDYIGCYWERS